MVKECKHVMHNVTIYYSHIGSDYEKLKPRQRSQRQYQIGKAVQKFTSPLIDIGLRVIGVKFETSSGNIITPHKTRKENKREKAK